MCPALLEQRLKIIPYPHLCPYGLDIAAMADFLVTSSAYTDMCPITSSTNVVQDSTKVVAIFKLFPTSLGILVGSRYGGAFHGTPGVG